MEIKNIPVAILFSCQDMKTIASQLHKHERVIDIRNTSEAVLSSQHFPKLAIILTVAPKGLGQYDDLGEYCGSHTASSVFLIIILCSTHYLGLADTFLCISSDDGK